MPSPIVHFQLATADPEATKAFLHEVFDWDISAGFPPLAGNIDTGAANVIPNDINVAGSLIQLPPGGTPFATVFVRVADLDSTLAKATERGSSVILPRTDVPRQGAPGDERGDGPTIAIFNSPLGLTFGLVQL